MTLQRSMTEKKKNTIKEYKTTWHTKVLLNWLLLQASKKNKKAFRFDYGRGKNDPSVYNSSTSSKILQIVQYILWTMPRLIHHKIAAQKLRENLFLVLHNFYFILWSFDKRSLFFAHNKSLFLHLRNLTSTFFSIHFVKKTRNLISSKLTGQDAPLQPPWMPQITCEVAQIMCR